MRTASEYIERSPRAAAIERLTGALDALVTFSNKRRTSR